MAILNTRDKEFRGQIEKTVVVKQYADGRTVLTAFPNMSKVVLSAKQKAFRVRFKEAQQYAVQYLSIPENKAAYKAMCKPGQRPHNLLIGELLKKEKPAEDPNPGRQVIAYGKVR
jgi:hypothetical protein